VFAAELHARSHVQQHALAAATVDAQDQQPPHLEAASQELFAAEIYRRLLHLHLHAQDLASAQAMLNVHQI
jgi:hypothetical protein